MRGRRWTIEEVEYLEEKWGVITIPGIAKKLNRTIHGVRNKAHKIGLERFIHQGEYVTFHQLIVAVGQKGNYSYLNEKLERDGFPIHHKKSVELSYKVVYIDEFWKWTEKNQTKIDFSKFEENMLGPEPKWVKRKRENDKLVKRKVKTTPWSSKEDKRLEELLNKYKYTYKDLSKMLNRTDGAIQRRIMELGLMARPIRENPHNVWTKENLETLNAMIKDRKPYIEMIEKIDKSEKAIRGKVYMLYGSENLDKAYVNLLRSELTVKG